MFFNDTKRYALQLHEKERKDYDEQYNKMLEKSNQLYYTRVTARKTIESIERTINLIANTPKDFDVKFGEINKNIGEFTDTEEFAQKMYDEAKKTTGNMVGGATLGLGVTAAAPSFLISIATIFGKASTGTAIRQLSGAAAEKAAVAWIGRTLAKGAVTKGAGMFVGQSILALAGPIGWTVTGVSVFTSAVSFSTKNKQYAEQIMEEIKTIIQAKAELKEMLVKIGALRDQTVALHNDLCEQRNAILAYANCDYETLSDDDKYVLGAAVNNAHSLAELLSKTIEQESADDEQE